MREAYVQMRLGGKIDLAIFYQFYLAEYPNIPTTYERVVKDMVGVPYLVEIAPNVFLYKTETVERELIGFQQFAQAFSLYFQSRPQDILEYVDQRIGVSKIEDEFGKLIYMN